MSETLLEVLQNECDRSRTQAAKLRRRLDEERAHSLRLKDQLRQMTNTQQQLQQQLRLAVGEPGSSGCTSGASTSQPGSITSLQRALEVEKCRLDQEKRLNGELAAEKKRLTAAQGTAAAERQRLLAVNESVRASLDRKSRELAAMQISLRDRGVELERAHEQMVLQARVHESEQAEAVARYRELTLTMQRERQRAARRASQAPVLMELSSVEHARVVQPRPGHDASAAAGGVIFGYANQPNGRPCGEFTCGRATLCEPPLDFEEPAAEAFVSVPSVDCLAAGAGSSSPAQEELLSLQRELAAARGAEREARRDAKEAREETARARTQLRLLQHALVDQKAEGMCDASYRRREPPQRRAASAADLGAPHLGGRRSTAGSVRRQRPAPVLLYPHTASLRWTAAAVHSAHRVPRADGVADVSDASEGEQLAEADSGCTRAKDGGGVPDAEGGEGAAGLGSGWPKRSSSRDGAGGGVERDGAGEREECEGVARIWITPSAPGHRCAPKLPAGAAVGGAADTRAAGGSGAGVTSARGGDVPFDSGGGGAGACTGGSSERGGGMGPDNGNTAAQGRGPNAWSAGSNARRSGGGRSARGATSPLRGSIGARARSALERIEASQAQLDPLDGLRGLPSPGKSMLDVNLES